MQPIQLLAPDGTLAEHEVYSPYISQLGEQDLRDLYRLMATERRMDAEATSLQRQGQLALWVPALGQEAAQAGTVSALRSTDMIFPTYRNMSWPSTAASARTSSSSSSAPPLTAGGTPTTTR